MINDKKYSVREVKLYKYRQHFQKNKNGFFMSKTQN